MDSERFTKMKHDMPFLKRALWETYSKKCIYCGMELMSKEVEIDHLWPRNVGVDFDNPDMLELKKELEKRDFETETLENYVVACKDCNGSAKKSNKSLGVSNLRFFYFITFKNRNSVLNKIEKYKRELTDGLDDESVIAKGELFKDIELLIPKRMINTFDTSFYAWGKGHACIWAFIPLDYKKEMSCHISTEELSKSNISYTLSHDDIIRYLFAGSGTSIEERPWCLSYSPEEGRKDYCVALPNIRIEATYEEVKELSEIIDDLFEEYMLQQSRVRDILGINSFESSILDEVLILSIPSGLWKDIIEFAKQHTCDRTYTEWNIFNTNCNDKMIELCLNDNDTKISNDTHFSAGVLVRFVAKEYKERVLIHWVPGHGTNELNKMDYFDNELKWKADYAHDWFLYKLVPYVLFAQLPVYKKLKYKEYSDKGFIRDYIHKDNLLVSYKQEVRE